jgi:patatin-like phospholipase/acyl hydrolase
MASSSAEQAPVKLLSIDGGGVRGLSALVVLEQLMDLTNYKREQLGLPHQELWEMFDMIGGTSTGG